MRITLNRALKYRNKLTASLAAESLGSVNTNIRASQAEDVVEMVSNASNEALEVLQRHIVDTSSLYSLRGIIHKANVESGSDAIINKMSGIQSVASALSSLSNQDRYSSRASGERVETAVDEINYAKSLAESEGKPFRVTSRSVKMEKVESFLEDFKKDQSLALSSLEEDRNKINHETIVEIPEDIVKTLASRNII